MQLLIDQESVTLVQLTVVRWRIRYLRIVGVIVNALMIASTSISGSHYLIDVVAGGSVTCLAIVTVGQLMLEGRAARPLTATHGV